jgi:peptidyl-prolyl cis-trans isomerase SurA
MFNKDREVVQTTTGVYEKGKNTELDKLKWKAGTVSKGYTKDGSFYFTKIEEIIPSSIKTLDEARGYVVADYQDALEKELIKRLKEKFEVKVDDAVLKSMVK